MLNEYKKQMWNDGPAKHKPWLKSYFNEYEQTHCCFGEADEDAPSVGEEALEQNFGYPVAEQRADAAAAAAGAGATGPDSTGGGSYSDGLTGVERGELGDFAIGPYDPDTSYNVVTNPATGEVNIVTDAGKVVTDDIPYNDLVDLALDPSLSKTKGDNYGGYFQALETSINKANQDFARQRQEDLAKEGVSTEVTWNPRGGLDGEGGYEFSTFGGGLASLNMDLGRAAKAYTDFSPVGVFSKVLSDITGIGTDLGKAALDKLGLLSEKEIEASKRSGGYGGAALDIGTTKSLDSLKEGFRDEGLEFYDVEEPVSTAENYDDSEEIIPKKKVAETEVAPTIPSARKLYANKITQKMPTFVQYLRNNPEIAKLPVYLQSLRYRQDLRNRTPVYTYSPESIQDAPAGAKYNIAQLRAIYPDIPVEQLLRMLGRSSTATTV